MSAGFSDDGSEMKNPVAPVELSRATTESPQSAVANIPHPALARPRVPEPQRLRTFHGDGRGALRHVFERDIVGDDVAVQVLVQLLARFRFHVQQKIIRPAQYIRVGQHAPLVVQEKRVAARPRRQAAGCDSSSSRAAAARDLPRSV